MGIICILLGIISFIGFILAGSIVANALLEYKATLAMAVTSLSTVKDTPLMIGVICFFAFIGLLIGLNLVMHGLTYNKLNKIQGLMKRKL